MKRFKEFDILKGIAITAVVLIHVTSHGTYTFDPTSYLYFIYLLANRLSQFAVPAFIFASCVLLSYIYRNDFRTITFAKLKTFYTKRFIRIIPPYVIWTLIYLIVRNIESNGSIAITLENYSSFLLRGDGYYHLYFVVVILQVYIFLPYLVHVISHVNVNFQHILLLSTVLQILCYYTYSFYLINYFPRNTRVIIWYIALILIGVWIGTNYETYSKKEKNVRVFLPVAIISGVLYTYLYHLSNMGQHVSSGMSTSVWYIYVSSMSLLLLYISKKVNTRLFEKAGQLSFGIYLMHPLFLFMMDRLYDAGNIILYNIYVLLEFFVILTLSYEITRWLETTSCGKYLLG
jgi:peptidoglycan/LPS O-acetylase OafA/YrhL